MGEIFAVSNFQSFSPINLSNLKVWLKGDGSLLTNLFDVVAWNDDSPIGNYDFTLGVNNVNPLKVNGPNNSALTPAVRFSNNCYLKNAGINFSKYTVIHVSRLYQDNDGEGRIFSSMNTNALIGSWNNYSDRMFAGSWVYQGTSTSYDWKITVGTVDLENYKSSFRQNGQNLASNINAAIALDGVSIGGWEYFGGIYELCRCDVAEVIIYDRVLTEKEIRKIEQYLNNKYQIYQDNYVFNKIIGNKQNLGLGRILSQLQEYSPKNISNLELWLKGDTGIILNGNSRVTTWQDQSGNNRHFVDRSTIGIGGSYVLPTVVGNTLQFTASSTYSSSTATVLACPSSSLNLTTPYTIFVVARGRSGSIISKSVDQTKRRKMQISMGDSGDIYTLESYGNGADTNISYVTGTGLNINTKRLIAARYNSNTSRELRYNGSLVNTSTADAGLQYTNAAPVYIGASPFQYNSNPTYNAEACFETYIYEIILYSRALTDNEIANIENYLNRKYIIY